VGAPALAATGIEQARIAMEHAFASRDTHTLPPLLPTGIYTIPEVSFVGDTEQSLQKKAIKYLVGECRYQDVPRGEIVGDHSGFLKLMIDEQDHRLLGVHVMGEQATEVVHLGLLAMMMNTPCDLFLKTCFNYPTLADMYKQATRSALAKQHRL
jgi:NAD(P) transhydrogenase